MIRDCAVFPRKQAPFVGRTNPIGRSKSTRHTRALEGVFVIESACVLGGRDEDKGDLAAFHFLSML